MDLAYPRAVQTDLGELGKGGQGLMGGGEGLCAWTAGTLLCQDLHCSWNGFLLSSASFVGKFWDGVARRTM